MRYLIGIDQSTQGTKALLLDESGQLICRTDRAHRQIISPEGWVSHDPMEILENTCAVVRDLLAKSGVDGAEIAGVGISNQRETSLCWDGETRLPLADAVVWQCSRAEAICRERADAAERIRQKTGLPLSPYFPAAKLRWLLDHTEQTAHLRLGTMDSWLLWKLTGAYRTDYSNASRTQLFNLSTLQWDQELCDLFGVPIAALPEVCDSDALFGTTDFAGILPKKVPVHSVLGDSHAALFAQGCSRPGMMKATYGTGSSIMMHVGPQPVWSSHGIATSLGWHANGETVYVLEGNINYTGAVIRWLKDDVGLISSTNEVEPLCRAANDADETVLVPAFSGLGAPHWRPEASAALVGLGRRSGRAEIVRAAAESIAQQITDVVEACVLDAGVPVTELRADGGPTRNGWLMQLQSDLLNVPVAVSETEEMSGVGAAWMAGIALGIYPAQIAETGSRTRFVPAMTAEMRQKKRSRWENAVAKL